MYNAPEKSSFSCFPTLAKLRESALVIEQSWMPSIETIHDSAAYVASIRLEALRLATTDESRILVHQRDDLPDQVEIGVHVDLELLEFLAFFARADGLRILLEVCVGH